MSDNIILNPGIGGATLKTDQLADGTHAEYVKLMDGTADSDAKIAGDATYGLDVDVTRSALPTGAATAALQGGGLPAALGAGGGLKVDGSGTALPVSAASLPLPTGAATEATLSTLNGKVTACNTGAVTISGALPAGTAAIGKLAANDGVDIGDVTVNNAVGSGVYVRPGTSAVFQVQSNSENLSTASLQNTANTSLSNIQTYTNGISIYSGRLAGTIIPDADNVARACVIASSSGDNTLISAASLLKYYIRSLAVFATSATPVSFYIHSTTDAALLGSSAAKITLDLTGVSGPSGFVLPMNPDGWFTNSVVNEPIQINLSAAVAVICVVTYMKHLND